MLARRLRVALRLLLMLLLLLLLLGLRHRWGVGASTAQVRAALLGLYGGDVSVRACVVWVYAVRSCAGLLVTAFLVRVCVV